MRRVIFEWYPEAETQVFEFPANYSDEQIGKLFYTWREKKTKNTRWRETTDEDEIDFYGISNIDEEV